MRRNLLFIVVLIASFAIPYFVFRNQDESGQTGIGDRLKSFWGEDESETNLVAESKRGGGGWLQTETNVTRPASRRVNQSRRPLGASAGLQGFGELQGETLESDAFPTLPGVGRPIELPAVGGPPVQSVADLIRFDAYPKWIRANWKNVSTRLTDLDLRGMRVPVMTGTNDSDVVGSLTYYFDRDQTLQRILLHGYTKDYGPVVDELIRQHDLQEVPSLINGLLVGRDEGNVNSLLRVQNARRAAETGKNEYELMLELNRAGSKLSEASRKIIEDGRKSNLW